MTVPPPMERELDCGRSVRKKLKLRKLDKLDFYLKCSLVSHMSTMWDQCSSKNRSNSCRNSLLEVRIPTIALNISKNSRDILAISRKEIKYLIGATQQYWTGGVVPLRTMSADDTDGRVKAGLVIRWLNFVFDQAAGICQEYCQKPKRLFGGREVETRITLMYSHSKPQSLPFIVLYIRIRRNILQLPIHTKRANA